VHVPLRVNDQQLFHLSNKRPMDQLMVTRTTNSGIVEEMVKTVENLLQKFSKIYTRSL